MGQSICAVKVFALTVATCYPQVISRCSVITSPPELSPEYLGLERKAPILLLEILVNWEYFTASLLSVCSF